MKNPRGSRMTPAISIIVPVYNVEKYLSRCVDSILAQTFRDFELILVDDGSTDKSAEICDKYAAKDSRIKVIHKENGGQSSARNNGLEIAIGKYIGFVDSDDWISTDCFEYLYTLIEKFNADAVSADFVFAYENKLVGFQKDKNPKEKIIAGADEILCYYLKQDKMHGKNDFAVWGKLFKRELFYELRFPAGKIYEDNIINFKLLQKCARYAKSTKKIYAYFQRGISTTKSILAQKHLALIDVSNEMLAIAQANYQADKKLIKLCKRKIAMSYFSVLAKYIRFGTDLNDKKIKELVMKYKKVKHFYLRTEKSIKIHLISFFMCLNITLARKLYEKFNGGGYKYRVVALESSAIERFGINLEILEHNVEVSYEIAA